MDRTLIENECDIVRFERKGNYLIDAEKLYIVTDIDDDIDSGVYIFVDKTYIKELDVFIGKIKKESRILIDDIISFILENKLNILPTNYAIISDNIIGIEAEVVDSDVEMYIKCDDSIVNDSCFYLNNFYPEIEYFSEEEDQKIAEAIWEKRKELVSKLSDQTKKEIKRIAKTYLEIFDNFKVYMDPEEYFCCFYNEKEEEYNIFFNLSNSEKIYYISNNAPNIEQHQSYAYNLGKIIIDCYK